nr:ACP phosphodiesterase [Ningiella ruwaisensis]
MGDFVKGSQYRDLPDEIARGVLLHRKIDAYTDAHPLVMVLKRKFPDDLRRVSGIVIDVYFDHLLCKCWNALATHSMQSMLDAFYSELEDPMFGFDKQDSLKLSKRFIQVKASLIEYRWLEDYKKIDAVERALASIEARLAKRLKARALEHKSEEVVFGKTAMTFLSNNAQHFENVFPDFYQDVQIFAKNKATELSAVAFRSS